MVPPVLRLSAQILGKRQESNTRSRGVNGLSTTKPAVKECDPLQICNASIQIRFSQPRSRAGGVTIVRLAKGFLAGPQRLADIVFEDEFGPAGLVRGGRGRRSLR